MNRERFRFYHVMLHESDLLVGVPHNCSLPGIEKCIEHELIRLRQILLEYSKIEPRFLVSLDPMHGKQGAKEIQTMLLCGQKTGTGPMASVAGLFAQEVGKRLLEDYGLIEVLVENGGDLYLHNDSRLLSVIHAGGSPLSDKMAFVLPEGEWGICTSSGTMGHSFSQGKADAVTVISSSAPLADAWATAIANQVQKAADIEPVLESVAGKPEILGCAVIVDNQVGIQGELEVKLLTSEE